MFKSKKIKNILRKTLASFVIFFVIVSLLSELPFGIKKAEATISNTKVIFLTTTGTNTWTVPNDWSDNNTIEVLGAGGGGRVGGTSGSGGGGGGAYAAINVTGITPGGSVTYRVGGGGAAGTAGGDTFFNRTSGTANTCADTVSVCAKGGSGATSATGAAGGAVASNKPAGVGFAGGAGGTGSSTGDTGGGGGGAAGPFGLGLVGGAGQALAPGAGGGGGGSGGGTAGSAGSGNGGNGGNAFRGIGSGAGANATNNTASVAGTLGGGGGGGAATTTTTIRAGATGGNGNAVWTSTHAADGSTVSVVNAGPGGGGGGAGASTNNGTGSTGGNGGSYGAGGGGAFTTAGIGAQGIIVITYVPNTVTNIKTVFLTTTGTQTWTVPEDWSDNNDIHVIGAGGGGRSGTTSGSGGGGGGAYASSTITGLSPGGSVTYRVGTGGGANTAGGDTFFNRTSGSANTCADTVSVCAKGGSGGSAATGAAGGAASGNKPAYAGFNGGTGGAGNNTGDTGGGGGSAAGPYGAGRTGGAGQGVAPGAGGGGAGVGVIGAAGSTNGGAGGGNFAATGSGTGANATNNTAATSGTSGGGGGGGAATTTVTAIRAGANGSVSEVWTQSSDSATIGPGAGGGGAGATTGVGTGSTGGNGVYGGGGGGAYTTGGTGGQGLIVIRYVPIPKPPTVTTQDASSVGQTTATLNGNITFYGSVKPTVRGFAWGTSPTMQGDTATTTENGTFIEGAFTNSSITFVCGTTYYSRAYATNSVGTSYGAISSSFTTTACPVPPIVTTQSASSVNKTSAVLNGNITNTGNASPTVRGFAWGTNPGLSGGDTATTTDTAGQPFSTGPFTGNPGTLTCNTTYYSRAYATNSAGTGYGAISASFTTSACGPNISGNFYGSDETTPVSGATIKLSVAGGAVITAGSTTDANGAWSFSDVTVSAGQLVTIWVDANSTTGTDNASLVFRYGTTCEGGTANCVGVKLFKTKVIIGVDYNNTENSITNADLANCDRDTACIDNDIGFTSNSGTLDLNWGSSPAKGKLRIKDANAKFAPGGDIIAGSFHLSNGAYIGSTETMTLNSNTISPTCSSTYSSIVTCISSGQFTAPNIISIPYSGNQNWIGTGTYKSLQFTNSDLAANQDIRTMGDIVCDNLSIQAGTTRLASITLGGNLTVNNTLTLDSTSSLYDVTFSSGSNPYYNTTVNNLNLVDTFANIYLYSSNFTVNGTITSDFSGGTFNAGTSNFIYSGTGAQTILSHTYHNLTIEGNRGANNVTLKNTGTITINNDLTYTATYSGGSLVTTGSTVQFTKNGGTIPTSLSYNNLQLMPSSSSDQVISSGTLTVAGALTVGDGTAGHAGATAATYNPIVNVAGAMTVANNATYTTGTSLLTVGSLSITGTLDHGSGASSLTTNGGITLNAGGDWTHQGTGTITLGGNVTNNSTTNGINFNSNGGATCSQDPDSIVITSTNTTPRTWSGAGTFTLEDVAMSYMTANANITLRDSTDNGNNANGTGTWTWGKCRPVLTTQDATSVTATSAVLNGNIIDTGITSPTVRGFAWGTSATMQGDTATTTDTAGQPFSTGAFTGNPGTLTCNTTYYARPYATNSAGTGYGPISNSFTTSACSAPPTVTTQSASSVTATTAVLNGNITDTGGASPTVRGFAWGTSATMQGDTATTTENGTFTTGAFTGNPGTLTCNTTYYSRAYATNSVGTSFGAISSSFTTSACVTGKFARTAGGNWNADSTWSTSSGGPANTTAPTASDNVIFDSNSGNVTITADAYARSIDMTIGTGNYAGVLNQDAATTLYIGDATAGTGNVALKFTGSTTYTADAASSVISFVSTSATQQDINFSGMNTGNTVFNAASNGSWRLTGAWGNSSAFGDLTLTKGSLDTNGQTVHVTGVYSSSGLTRSITLGASTMHLHAALGSTGWSVYGSALTISGASADLIIYGGSADFMSNSTTYNSVTFVGGSSGGENSFNVFSGTLTVGTLGYTGVNEKTGTLTLAAGGSYVVTNALNVDGYSGVNRLLVRTSTLGTTASLTVTGATVSGSSNVDFRDIAFVSTGAVDLSSITGGSGDAGGNTISGGGTLTFSTSDDWYWYNASGGTYNYSDNTHWYTATNGGGTRMDADTRNGGNVKAILPQDNLFFDANSVNGATTIEQDLPRMGRTIDFSGVDPVNFHVHNIGQTVYGGMTFVPNVTVSGTSQNIYFEGRNSSFTYTPPSVASFAQTIFYGIGATYTLLGDLMTGNNNLYIYNGTFDANGYNISGWKFISVSNGARTVKLGSGTHTFIAPDLPWQLESSGMSGWDPQTSTVVISAVGGTITTGGLPFNNISLTGTGATATTFADSFSANTLTIGQGTADKTVKFTAGTTVTVNSFVATGASGKIINIDSTVPGSFYTLTDANGGQNVNDYLSVTDSKATPASTFAYGANGDADAYSLANGWSATLGPTISGILYNADETTPATSGSIKLSVAGGAALTSSVDGSGNWSFSNVTVSAGQVVTIWADAGSTTGTDNASLVFKYGTTCEGGTTSCTGLKLFKTNVIIGVDYNNTSNSITNSDLSACDNDTACVDTDIGFTSNLSTTYNLANTWTTNKLRIKDANAKYAPGGTVTIKGLNQSSGTVTGGAAAWNISGNFVLSGGSFTSTSGTLSLLGDSDWTSNTGSPTFDANGGTVVFAGNRNHAINSGSISFNDVTVGNSSGGGANLTITGTMDINGDLDLSEVYSLAGGSFSVAGNVAAYDVGSGSATTALTLDGSTTQTVSAPGGTGKIPGVTVTNSTTVNFQNNITILGSYSQGVGTVNFGTGNISIYADFSLSGGAFTSTSGSLSVARDWTSNTGSPTFDANGGTVVFYGVNFTHNINAGSIDFNDVIFNGSTTYNVTGTLDVNDDFTITDAYSMSGGAITVGGDLVSSDNSINNNGTTITLDGTGAQLIDVGSGVITGAVFTIDKASGTATLASNLTTPAALTITRGTLDQGASYNLIVNGALSVDTNGILQNTGTGDLTLGGNVSNAGTITLNGNGGSACNQDNDDIVITSNNTTPRTWSGAGTFTLEDVAMSYMTANANITLRDSTDNGNNANGTGTWTWAKCKPTVTTQSASSVTATSAVLNGNITDIGVASPTVRGFAWGTNVNLSGGDTATTTENGTFSTGAFTGNPGTLTCNTTYYSRAYATNSSGTGYGAISSSFTTSACGATITGTVYSNEGTTAITTGPTVRVKVNGAGNYSAVANGSGVYTIPGVTVAAGNVVTVFLDGATEKATTVTRAEDSSSTITVPLYQNRLIVTHEDAGPITNVDLNQFDNACNAGTGDSDILFCVDSANLTVSDGNKLLVWDNKTFTPGGQVTTSPSNDGTDSNPDGDIATQSNGLLNMESYSLFVGGDLSGGINAINGCTTTFTATASGHTISVGAGLLDDVVFNGIGGGWSFDQTSNVSDLTVTAGTLSGTNNLTISGNFLGDGSVIFTAGQLSITGSVDVNFGGNSNWTFNTLTHQGTGKVTAVGTGSITIGTYLYIKNGQSLDAGQKTWILSGVGTGAGNNMIWGGGSLIASSSTFQFSGGPNINVPSFTYNNLTLGGTGTYTLPASNITLRGDLTVTTGATVTKSASNKLIFAKGDVQTVTDNTASKQDLGKVQVSSNTTNTELDFGSDIKMTSLVIDNSQDLYFACQGLTLTGSGTGSSRPLVAGTGTHIYTDSCPGNYIAYTGTSNTEIYDETFSCSTDCETRIIPASGNPTYTLGTAIAQTLVFGKLILGDGTNAVTVNMSTYNPDMEVSKGFTINNNVTFTKGSGRILFSGYNKTLTDNTASKQDLGKITVSSSAGGSISLGSSLKATSLLVSPSDSIFSLNGSNTLTITGSGTGASSPFLNSGTFTPSTGTVIYAGTGATDIASTTYNNLTLNASSGTPTFSLAGNTTVNGALNITTGTLSQGASYNLTSGAVTVGASGVWSNLGTGDITLSGNVTNAGTITLNSNNGSQCTDGTNDIVIRSSVNNTLRSWSGAGTFTLYNLDVDDMTGTVTAYNSLLSGDTTWTPGNCGPTISGVLYNADETTPATSGSIKMSVEGGAARTASVDGSGNWSFTGVTVSAGQLVTVWVDANSTTGTDNATLVFKYGTTCEGGTANCTGLKLFKTNVIIGVDYNNTANNVGPGSMYVCDNDSGAGCSDTDIGYTTNPPIPNLTLTWGTNQLRVKDANAKPGLAAENVTVKGYKQSAGTTSVTTGTWNVSGDFILSGGSFTSTSGTLSVSGNWSHTAGTFTHNSGTVTFDGGTTGKTINALQSFNNVIFNGSGGAWSPLTNTMTVAGDLTMTAGTLDNSSGSADVVVSGGDVTGNGTINLTAGTLTLDGVGNFGGNTAWTFNNLTFGDGSGVATSTATGSGDITVNGVLNIANNQVLEAGSKTYHLMGSGTPFTRQSAGVFKSGTSTFSYENTTSAFIVHTANSSNGSEGYYNLQTNPASGSPTYTFKTTSTSFLAGTKVLTPSGEKNIEDLKVGDLVKAYDTKTNSVVSSSVTDLIHGTKDTYYIINNKVKATDNHVFFLADKTQRTVEELKVGDVLSTYNEEETIVSIDVVRQQVDVYDIEVETYHTFYAEKYLVHNPPPTIGNIINNFVLTGSGSAIVNANVSLFGLVVAGDLSIGANQTLQASGSIEAVFSGNFTNSGNFVHNNGWVWFSTSTINHTINPGSSHFYNLKFTSAGAWSPLTNKIYVDGNLDMTQGTLDNSNGSADVEVQGNVVGTAGVINFTTNTFTQNATTSRSFGASVNAVGWTFNNLTFTSSQGTPTITTNTGGTGDITVNGSLVIGANTTFNAGNRIYHLTKSGTTTSRPFTNAGTLTPSTSTFIYESVNDTDVETVTYNNLTINSASSGRIPAFTLLGNTIINGALGITKGTLSQGASFNLTSGAVTVGANGIWSNIGIGNITLSGDVTNAGTITIETSGHNSCGTAGSDTITLTSNNTTPRVWSGAGTFNIWDVNMSYMTANANITLNSSTNSGNNANGTGTWTWAGCGPTISGTLYESDETTPATSGSVKLSVAGGAALTSSVDGSGNWSFSSVTVSAGQVVTIWADANSTTGTDNATLVFKYGTTCEGGTANCTGLKLFKTNLIIGVDYNNTANSINISDLAACDNDDGVGCGDTDIGSSQFLTTASISWQLRVKDANAKFAVGSGSITVPGIKQSDGSINGGSAAWDVNGSLTFSGGTFTPTSGTMSVNGSWSNMGATINNSSGTIIFDSTTGGNVLSGNLWGYFHNVSFDGASGGWNVQEMMSTTGNLLVNAGTVTFENRMLNVGGNFTGAGVVAGSASLRMVEGGNLGSNSNWALGAVTISENKTVNLVGSGEIIVNDGMSGGVSVDGTLNAGSKTIRFTGNSMVGVTANLGIFNPQSSHVIYNNYDFAGIAISGSYNNLTLAPASANEFMLNSTLTVNNDLVIGDGTNLTTVNYSDNDLTIRGNLTLNNNVAITKGMGVTTFAKGGVQTWTDNGSTKQDMGIVKISSNTTDTTLNLGSNVKFTSLTVDANQTFSQGATYSLTTTGAGTVITNNGIWSNTGTGDITLSGDVSNAGTITLNSNNGSQCTDGNNDIAITSSQGGTQRDWTGAGIFNIYNVAATDQKTTTNVVTAFNSTLTNTTWLVGSCGITISGTVFGFDETTPLSGTTAIRMSVGGAASTTVNASNGVFTFSNVTNPSAGSLVNLWTSGGSDRASLVFKYGSTCSGGNVNCSGLKLFKDNVIIGPNYNSTTASTTISDLSVCDNDTGTGCAGDTDIGYTANNGALTLTWPTNQLRIATSTAKFAPGGNVTAGGFKQTTGAFDGSGELAATPGFGIEESGAIISETGTDQLNTIAKDANYIYIGGFQGSGCVSGADCWRVEKRDITTGELVTAFGGDGVVQSDPTSGSDQILSIVVDSNYIYIGGFQVIGCSTGADCWRVEKRDKTTGALVTAFDSDGVVQSDPTSGTDQITSIVVDSNYIYLAGYQGTGAGCTTGSNCMRVEKRDITTGALVTAFDSDGVVQSDPTSSIDRVASIVVDSSYIYLGGYQLGSSDGGCASGNYCWRVEKRNITTGALVSAFMSGSTTGGVVQSDPTSGTDKITSIAVDNNYIYIGGYQGGACSSGSYCWRVEKRNITTGALVSAFDSDGVVQSDPTNSWDHINSIAIDSSYIYLSGYQLGSSGGGCTVGDTCWRLEKRNITTGALVSAFDSDGVVQSDPTNSADQINSIVIDSNYVYLAGYQSAGTGCVSGSYCWRVEKRDITTGQLVTAFDSDGVVQSDPTGIGFTSITTIAKDSNYLYLAGYQDTGVGCVTGADCWRVEKRDITTGQLVTAFDSDGVVQSDPTSGTDQITSIVVDSNYIYLAGYQGTGAGCVTGGDCWRVEKRNITTGALVSAFDSDGVVQSDPTSSTDYLNSIFIDNNYIYLGGYQSTGTGCVSGSYCWRVEKRNITNGALVSAFDSDGVVQSDPTSGIDQITSITLDSSYIYLGGYQSIGDGCTNGQFCWRVEKRNITNGALVSAFDSDGVVQSDPTSSTDYLISVVIDTNYIYLGGYQDTGAGCVTGGDCWRVEKRDITTGALVNAFGSNGVVQSDPTSGADDIISISIDSSYIYLGGYQDTGTGCVSGSYCWRVEKRDITTGQLVTAFDSDGVVQSDPTSGGDFITSIIKDSSYIYLGGQHNSANGRLEKRDITTGALVTGSGGASTNGTFDIGGPFTLSGGTFISTPGFLKISGTVTGGGTFLHNNGTVEFGGASTQNITSAFPYYNLKVNKSSNPTSLTGDSTIAGNLLISAGTFDMSSLSNAFTIGGGLNISSGATFSAPNNMTIRGDFTNDGTFTSNNKSITLNPVGSVVNVGGSSNTNFYNFNLSKPGTNVRFKAGKTFGVSGALNLQGASGAPIILSSDSLGTYWKINFLGSANLNYVTLRDAGCESGSQPIFLNDTVNDGGHNDTCWHMIQRGSGGGSSHFMSVDGSAGGGSVVTGGGADTLTSVSDNFNRANVSPIAGNWTSCPAFTVGMQISSNTIGSANGGSVGCAYWNAKVFSNNQYSQGTYSTGSTNGPMVRSNPNGAYFLYVVNANSIIFFRRDLSSGSNNIGTISSLSLVPGDTIRLEIIGSTLRALVNGVSVGTVNDATYSSGSAGVAGDNHTPGLDNWEGGDLATPPAGDGGGGTTGGGDEGGGGGEASP